nr:putative sugar transporter [Arabidopsis thaliana]
MQLFVGVGLSAFYALGTAVAWRSLAILGSIPSLVVLPLLFFIPESPRWLAKVGREKEVEGVLLSLRGAKSDVSDEAATILEYTKHVEQQDIDSRGFFKLFQRRYALPLTIGVVLISMPQLGGLNGYTFYTDTIFTSTDDWRRFRCFACGYIRKTFSPTVFSSWNVLGLSSNSHFILLAEEQLLGNRNTNNGSH